MPTMPVEVYGAGTVITQLLPVLTTQDCICEFNELVTSWTDAVTKARRAQFLEHYSKMDSITVIDTRPAQRQGAVKRSDLWLALKNLPLGRALKVNHMDSNIRNGIGICESLMDMDFTTKRLPDSYTLVIRTR